MRKLFLLLLLASVLNAAAASASIPEPAPRVPAQRQTQTTENQNPEDPEWALEELRKQYPNLNIPTSADVQWITPTGTGADADIRKALENNAVIVSPNRYQAAQYEDEEYDEYDENSPTAQELRDAQLARQWMDVREDLELREIDKKALALVREYAGAKNALPPVQGQNGAVSYAYGDHVPKILCRPNRVTDVALQPGEKVSAVHAGDTVRWQIAPARSGGGANEVVHLVIKPLMPDISTNLLVMTDKRTYNLDLVSTTANYIPAVRFTYPDEMIEGWNAFIAANKARQSEVVLSDGVHNLAPDNLYFGYRIVKGKNVPWSPVRVFDDGVKTYIEMPSKYTSLEAPVLLFYEGTQQKLVNYRVKDRFYVVDRVMTKKAVLIAGKTRVVIEREKEEKEKKS